MPCKQEVAEREGWAQLGFHSCAYWLNFKCGIDMNTARHIMWKSSFGCTGGRSAYKTPRRRKNATMIGS
jgi:hypothetical protein